MPQQQWVSVAQLSLRLLEGALDDQSHPLVVPLSMCLTSGLCLPVPRVSFFYTLCTYPKPSGSMCLPFLIVPLSGST